MPVHTTHKLVILTATKRGADMKSNTLNPKNVSQIIDIQVNEKCIIDIMKSTKVLNPRRGIMRRVHEKYACAYARNTHAVQIRMLYRDPAIYQLLGNSEHTG